MRHRIGAVCSLAGWAGLWWAIVAAWASDPAAGTIVAVAAILGVIGLCLSMGGR